MAIAATENTDRNRMHHQTEVDGNSQQRLCWGRDTRKPVPITKRSRLAGPTILFLNRFQPLVRNEPHNGERNLSKQKHREILIRLPFHPRKRSNHYPSNLDLKFIDGRCARSSWQSRISQTSEWLPPSSNWNFFSKSSHTKRKKEEGKMKKIIQRHENSFHGGERTVISE